MQIKEDLFSRIEEVGRHAATQATTSLSRMLQRKVSICLYPAQWVAMEKVSEKLGGAEQSATAIYFGVAGAFTGSIVLLLQEKQALRLADLLVSRNFGKKVEWDALSRSALKEFGNISASAYLMALSHELRVRLHQTVPGLATDMLQAVLDSVLIQASQKSEQVLLLKTDFVIEQERVEGYLLFLPNLSQMQAVLKMETKEKKSDGELKRKPLLSKQEENTLKEIGNIGASQAATSLKQLVNRKILVQVPQIRVMPPREFLQVVGPEVRVVATHLKVVGDLEGGILFVMSRANAIKLVDLVMGQEAGATRLLQSVEQSALKETGSILSASYLNAVSSLKGVRLIPSVPRILVGQGGAVLQQAFKEELKNGNSLVGIENVFLETATQALAHFFFLPRKEGLKGLMERVPEISRSLATL